MHESRELVKTKYSAFRHEKLSFGHNQQGCCFSLSSAFISWSFLSNHCWRWYIKHLEFQWNCHSKGCQTSANFLSSAHFACSLVLLSSHKVFLLVLCSFHCSPISLGSSVTRTSLGQEGICPTFPTLKISWLLIEWVLCLCANPCFAFVNMAQLEALYFAASWKGQQAVSSYVLITKLNKCAYIA